MTAPSDDARSSAPTPSDDAAPNAMAPSVTAPSATNGETFRFADIVGLYRLVVSEALLDFIERAFVEPAPPNEREQIRRTALAEARQSELRIDLDGTIASRAGDQEFYRVKVAVGPRDLDALRFEKAPNQPVTLVLASPHRIVAHQPNKPAAEFVRIDDG